MQSSEIRQAFLEFFANKEHSIIPSAPLILDDPTLLFVNAGMVPFKNVFLGRENRPYNRATSAQKCARLSGKHNDLEEVGPSPRHHTFFEMLGNFSFGDYFKEDAIKYAWEFATEVLNLDPELLWATVYEDDDESALLWEKHTSIPVERIEHLGKADNWWAMGETGPNGPCSEIFFDRGLERCTCNLKGMCSPKTASEQEDCERYWEFWNLVFIQYNTNQNGETIALDNPSVDTGLGMERITTILQNKEANYDTDIFEPILKNIQTATGQSDVAMAENIIPYRVIADHSRSMTFMIADGVLPGNEDKSYVLRMLIRRAIRFGKKLGLDEPFLVGVAQSVIGKMGRAYPELIEREDFILKAIAVEEERFARTFSSGIDFIEALFAKKQETGDKLVSGTEAFFLHDTHGFHIQIIEDIARERGFSLDRDGFSEEMEMQRERSKGAKSEHQHHAPSEDELKELPETIFLGFEQAKLESEILWLKRIDESEIEVVLADTVFFAQGGGQTHDAGSITKSSGGCSAEILAVGKDSANHFVHHLSVTEGQFQVGDRVICELNIPLRKATERNHTATHILHAALRKILDHKTGIQAGSRVAPDELRFDFTHFSAVSDEELARIESMANDIILRDLPVSISEEKLEAAKARGAMALFAEDYQGKELVRVVSIESEEENEGPVSIELCGGAHVQRTGEIGLFKIIREEGVAAGVRRVYVVTGRNLIDYLSEKEKIIVDISSTLRSSEHEISDKIGHLLSEKAELEKQLKKLTTSDLKSQRDQLVSGAEMIGNCNAVFAKLSLDMDSLKQLSDLVEESLGEVVVVLGGDHNGSAVLVAKVCESMTDTVRAGDLVREASQLVGGKGGGNPRFAQGGGDQPEHLDAALEAAKKILQEKLSV
jgi:alanyl-tRNA synthetase